MSQILTAAAFSDYRATREPQQMHADAQRYDGDTDQMIPTDGLEVWEDGDSAGDVAPPAVPDIDGKPSDLHLWVVTQDDVRHAKEQCAFGSARQAKCVKHSNLTGGTAAYAGGEFAYLDPQTLLLNGCSGRYRITTLGEMSAIERAFRRSGYKVWSMGWNEDTDRPAMFGTQDPTWVKL